MSKTSPTILVIDNDEGLVTAVATRLEHDGYTCIKAGTGAQGIAAFQDHEIDLVITDLNMPEGNGIAFAKALRRTSRVPIIVVTGFHEAFGRELRSIANLTVIDKPFSAGQLIDLVETDLALSGCTLPIGQDSTNT